MRWIYKEGQSVDVLPRARPSFLAAICAFMCVFGVSRVAARDWDTSDWARVSESKSGAIAYFSTDGPSMREMGIREQKVLIDLSAVVPRSEWATNLIDLEVKCGSRLVRIRRTVFYGQDVRNWMEGGGSDVFKPVVEKTMVGDMVREICYRRLVPANIFDVTPSLERLMKQ